MKKSVVWQCVALFVLFALAMGPACYAEGSKQDISDVVQQIGLKKQCLSATITAINLEIDRHQGWIDFRSQQGDQKKIAELQEKLDVLKVDLEKHLAMNAEDYVLPQKASEVAWVGDHSEKNAVLYIENMSKSGPWYHLAGIAGGDYAMLQPNTKTQMSFYPVYPRSYWGMNSAYVYVSGINGSDANITNGDILNKELDQQSVQGKKIRGEVFMSQHMWPFNDLVTCEDYQIYLLKDIKPGSKGELKVDSKKSSFDFTLSEEELGKYSYIEFVSKNGNKTMMVSEIKDDALKIILEPQVIVKKPAIYLYPPQKSQIEITHNFKGKILNTYPSYTDNWTVIAEPNGNLLNVKDSRYYKYLFWDGVYAFPSEHYQFKSGFYIKKEDYVSFLQDKLEIIGLNENEINDFIVYWLPAMSNHNYCFIHFRINDNIDGSSVLETKPAADTKIRVFMEFSGVDSITSASNLPEQFLPSVVRTGFTLVEWGGAEIGNSKFE